MINQQFRFESKNLTWIYPWEYVKVSIASEPKHITQKHVYTEQKDVEDLYTQSLVEFEKVHKIRTVHIWWGELENRFK